jgi:hypothetical protein
LEEDTKPAHERHLQVCPTLRQTCFSGTPTDPLHKPLLRLTKRVISKKLVTIFARHLDSFTVTQNLSSVYQFRKTGSGQFLQPRLFNRSPGLAKIAPWWLASRDSFLAKVPGLMVGVAAPPTLSAHTRWPLTIIRSATRKSLYITVSQCVT